MIKSLKILCVAFCTACFCFMLDKTKHLSFKSKNVGVFLMHGCVLSVCSIVMDVMRDAIVVGILMFGHLLRCLCPAKI